MPKVSPIQTNFTGGEISPRMLGRVDLERYNSSVQQQLNMITQQQGGSYRRSGTHHVEEVKDSSDECRLFPFEFSELQAYILEFGDQYVRFYKDEASIVSAAVNITGASNASPIVITVASNTFTDGHEVTISGVGGNTAANGVWTIANGTGTTFELVGSTGNGAYTSGGTAEETIELAVDYTASELFDIGYTQSADVLYLAHQAHPPAKLTRSSHTDWSITDIDFIDGPYMPEETDISITPSGTSGSVTLTASASLWTANDVGRLVRLKHSSTWTWFKITAYSSGTEVTADVKSTTTTASGSSAYRLGAFYIGNYPQVVTFHDQRLVFANTPAEPQTAYLSVSGLYEVFEPTDGGGTSVLDSSAFGVTMASNKVNAIRWLVSGNNLAMGTSGSEWQMKAGTINESITPTNVSVVEQTSRGSKFIRPIKVDSSVLFVQRSGRRLREYQYSFQSDNFQAKDISILAEHLLRRGTSIKDMAYQQEPDSVVWIVRQDGILLGMTYVPEQNVVGFHQHQIGGSFGSSNAVVESVAVIPTPDGTNDQLWLVVKRTVDGNTVRYIEFMEEAFDPVDSTDKQSMFFVDSGLVYDGAATNTITGLEHLEGQEVAICADEAVHPVRTVENGSITLNADASYVVVGLAYSSRIKTLRPEVSSNTGTSQGKVMRINKVKVRLLNSLSLKYGLTEATLTDLSFRATNDPMDSSPPLFTGDKVIELGQDYSTDATYILGQDSPYPLNILALMPDVNITEP